jgi:hypothetical protein
MGNIDEAMVGMADKGKLMAAAHQVAFKLHGQKLPPSLWSQHITAGGSVLRPVVVVPKLKSVQDEFAISIERAELAVNACWVGFVGSVMGMGESTRMGSAEEVMVWSARAASGPILCGVAFTKCGLYPYDIALVLAIRRSTASIPNHRGPTPRGMSAHGVGRHVVVVE